MIFRGRVLERCYQSSREASRRWGPAVGNKYIQRITVLQSTPTFDDLFKHAALKLHPLVGNRQGDYAITIQGKWRLILAHDEAASQLIVKEVSDHYDH